MDWAEKEFRTVEPGPQTFSMNKNIKLCIRKRPSQKHHEMQEWLVIPSAYEATLGQCSSSTRRHICINGSFGVDNLSYSENPMGPVMQKELSLRL